MRNRIFPVPTRVLSNGEFDAPPQSKAQQQVEIPEDLQERFGFTPLGGADSEVKQAILGRNAARLYGLEKYEKV